MPCFWWELVECVKKLLLTGLLTFVFRDEVAQVAFAMLVALASVLLLHLFRPYADPEDQLARPSPRRGSAGGAPRSSRGS